MQSVPCCAAHFQGIQKKKGAVTVNVIIPIEQLTVIDFLLIHSLLMIDSILFVCRDLLPLIVQYRI